MLKNKLKSVIAGLAAATLAIAGPAIVIADNGNSNAGDQITYCHSTSSQTNPYVKITTNANGVVNGHLNHHDSGDIIPPFDYNDHGTTKHFVGQGDQSILANGCVVASAQSGGQGGVTNQTNTQTGQVLGGSSSANSNSQSASAQAQGAVSAGAGGANAFSLTTLQRVW